MLSFSSRVCVRHHDRVVARAWCLAASAAITAGLSGCSVERASDATLDGPPAAINAEAAADIDLLRTPLPRDSAGNITVVVEIPAGTNEKWEVNKTTGRLEWEQLDGRPRVVAFLPYPGNYGFTPRTLLSREAGGDGDPLDVILLGSTLPRGTVATARLLGVLRMSDGGEADDKLIAVSPEGPFARVQSLDDMRSMHPGVLDLVADWFRAYKGPGIVDVREYADREVALRILDSAIVAFTP